VERRGVGANEAEDSFAMESNLSQDWVCMIPCIDHKCDQVIHLRQFLIMSVRQLARESVGLAINWPWLSVFTTINQTYENTDCKGPGNKLKH
jgi:hypothetical protein